MKVLFVISCLSYGGAEKNLILVANYLQRKGHGVAVCNFNERPTVRKPDEGVICFDMEYGEEKTGRYAWIHTRKMQYKFLAESCKRFSPDVIVSFLNMPNALSVICGKRMHIPVIISERADPYQAISKIDRIMHFLYNRADGAVFQTEGAKAFYSEKLQKRSTVIPNPVIISNKDGIRHDHSTAGREIAFVGRFELKQKRQDVMIKAMRIVLKSYPDYKLVFWGDGEDEARTKELSVSLGISDNVVFAGASSNVLADIAQSEMFVLTSDYEGIPNVLIEAMSIGMPCIATDCSPGGARMLLDNGKYGIIVPCGDEQAVADAIVTYIENKELAREYGAKAMCITERFSYDVIMQKWEDYLLKTCNKK